MKILFISHDANRAGAQIFLLNIMQYFQQKKMSMHLLLLGGGSLEKDFEQICPVSKYPNEPANTTLSLQDKVLKKLKLKDSNPNQAAKEALKAKLQSENFDCIYTNTIATAWVMPELLSYLKAPLITHIHELEFSIQLYSSAENRKFLFDNTTKLIACSQAVADNIIENHGVSTQKVEVIHSFVNNADVLKRAAETKQAAIRRKYGIPEKAFLIGGCGNAEWRKGLDIFALLAKNVLSIAPENIHFAWVGVKKEGEYYNQVIFDVIKMGIQHHITFIEPTPEAVELINCFDIFAVVSREDPFPLVMLEAALSERIIFGFEKTGGCSEFIEQDAGQLFPYLDIQAMAQAIVSHKTNPTGAQGKRAKEKVLTLYSFENSILKIEKLLENLS
ncbi:glycosyltransferase family 4 protein [Emticicia soli]|uniref:Glycosyltransferase family 4 protein n=1 Tax=Emticicia soli TaxID=2027878 RepID=A0ABW5J6Y1_9BACT